METTEKIPLLNRYGTLAGCGIIVTFLFYMLLSLNSLLLQPNVGGGYHPVSNLGLVLALVINVGFVLVVPLVSIAVIICAILSFRKPMLMAGRFLSVLMAGLSAMFIYYIFSGFDHY